MAKSKIRWMTVWTAAGALATAGGVLATVLVAGASDDNPAVMPPVGPAESTTVVIMSPEITTPTPSKTTETSSTDTPTTTSPSTVSLAEREDRLRTKLTGVFTSCEPRRNIDIDIDPLAALDCVSSAVGPSLNPLVIQFADASDMSDYYTKERQGVDSNGSCSLGQEYFGTWNWGDSTVAGKSVCIQGSTSFRIYWGYDRENIGIIAEGYNATVLYQWWSAYGSKAVA